MLLGMHLDVIILGKAPLKGTYNTQYFRSAHQSLAQYDATGYVFLLTFTQVRDYVRNATKRSQEPL